MRNHKLLLKSAKMVTSHVLEIPGRVPSGKNHKQVAIVRGKVRLFPSKAFTDYFNRSIPVVMQQGVVQVVPPLKIDYAFMMIGEAATDIDNMLCTINDLLQECGIIADDMAILEATIRKIGNQPEYKTVIRIDTAR